MVRIISIFAFALLTTFPAYAVDITSSWDANTEADLAGYKVYYGTVSGNYTVSLDVGNATSATIDSLDFNTTYFFAVTAYDNAGNESDFSDEVRVDIPPPPDTQAPSRPTNVTIVLNISKDSQ